MILLFQFCYGKANLEVSSNSEGDRVDHNAHNMAKKNISFTDYYTIKDERDQKTGKKKNFTQILSDHQILQYS